MKRAIASLPFVLISLLMAAQPPFPSKSDISQFSKSTTCVVLEDDQFSPFNVFIQKAMKEYWAITPFEFIGHEEFEIRMKKPAYSFIMLTETTFDKDKSGTSFNFINLVQGKFVSKISALPEICAVPLSSAGEDDLDYGYKLGAILLFMQKHAGLIMEDPSKTGRRYLRFYNENIPAVLSKIILVKQEDLSPAIDNIDKIKAIYTGNIEIVTEEEIVRAIRERTPGTVILHKVGPPAETAGGICFKMLIGTDDSNMYYYNSHNIDKSNPDGLLPADLKRLARFD